MGQMLREAPVWVRGGREEVAAQDLASAVSVSAGWSVFVTQDGAVYNTYRVYPHSRIVTPLCSVLLKLVLARRGQRVPGWTGRPPRRRCRPS